MRVGGVSSSVNFRIFRFFEETLLRASERLKSEMSSSGISESEERRNFILKL